MTSGPATESYPGNPSLPREVREKILSTFRHTLNLYKQGKTDDCLIGCDFILKMDPRFGPARKLLEKARNPAADVDVAGLEALVTATPTPLERVAAVDPERLLVRAVESYNARDFGAAIAAAEQVLAVRPGNRDALEVLDKAAGKKAAQPLFDASRQRALAALDDNRPEDARRELERMRGLDPDHPAVALLERRLGSSAATASVEPPSPPPAAPAPEEDLRFDLTGPELLQIGSLGGEMSEPEIHFDDGAAVSQSLGAPAPRPESQRQTPAVPTVPPEDGLEALSLDSLSLDAPSATPPAPAAVDLEATNPGRALKAQAPAPPPGSPADLWSSVSEELEQEQAPSESLVPPPEPPRAPKPSAPPPPPAPTPLRPTPAPRLAPIEDEDGRSSEREIEALLRQGDEVAARGDRQQAIEVWSRIFLMDINNTEAVTRIEAARQEMAEGNRVISDGLKTGREKFEAGDLAAAKELFEQVLAIDENEPTARFYIERIEEQLARSAAPGRTASPAPAPESASTPATELPAARAPRRSRGLRVPPRVLAMIAVAVVACGVGVYFVFKSPKSVSAPRRAPAPAAGSLAHAKQLAGTGQIAEARKELLSVPSSSPDYAEARKMLAGFKQEPEAPAAAPIPAAAPDAAARAGTPGPSDPARLRASGEKALAEKHYIEALKNFNLAAPAFRNDPTFAQAMGLASDKVTALAAPVKLYNEGEYETAIPALWRLYQEDHDNQDARSYLLRSYYNQGITQLQNGLFRKAIQSFDEALALDPNDTEIIRHRKFAEHYQKGDLDLMGRIYVRHLNHRP